MTFDKIYEKFKILSFFGIKIDIFDIFQNFMSIWTKLNLIERKKNQKRVF